MLDQLPEAVSQPPATLWSVFARSLGEQGAAGRTALAWRWALTGGCPSPITLNQSTGRPPGRRELLGEADAQAEHGSADADPGDQIMYARAVLQWLAGDFGALPLFNSAARHRYATEGASMPYPLALINDVHSWAMLGQWRTPIPDEPGGGGARVATERARVVTEWAHGVVRLLDWICGVSVESPVTGLPLLARKPSLYQVSLDVQHAMVALGHARETGEVAVAARMEAIMETFVWLAGWSLVPPVDRHGHGLPFDCVERHAPCVCDAQGYCLRAACSACWRVSCVRGFG
jgi:hypothetical protein